MRFLLALTCAVCASASPIEVGPISLTGWGTLSNPDWSPAGGEGLGGLGLTLHASGANGKDTVLIDTPDIEVWGADFFQDVTLTGLVFDDLGGCTIWMAVPPRPYCSISIDGVTGFGAFHLGAGGGLVQVYAQPDGVSLLAEAQIINTRITATSVTYGPGNFYCPTCPGGSGSFMAQLVVDPQASQVPESSTWTLALIGLVTLFTASLRCRSSWNPNNCVCPLN